MLAYISERSLAWTESIEFFEIILSRIDHINQFTRMNLSNATCKTVHDDRMNQTFPNWTFLCYVSEREPFTMNQINSRNQDFLLLHMCDHSMNWFNSYARENCLGLSNSVTQIRLSSAAYVRENYLGWAIHWYESDFPVISTK